VVADVVRGRPAPFDPQGVANEHADLAKEYGCRSVTGDNYAGEWVAGAFRAAGVAYERAELTASELFLEGLPLFARGMASIPPHPALLRELRLLERRVSRSGKDSVSHGVGGNDDHAVALFGAMVLVNTHRPFIVTAELLQRVLAMPVNPARRHSAWGFCRRAGLANMANMVIPKERRGYPASVLPEHKFRQPNEGEQR
jgi:hypothetical protein